MGVKNRKGVQDILDGAGFSDVLTEVRDMNKAEKDEAQKEEDPPAAAEVAAASAEAGQGHNLPLMAPDSHMTVIIPVVGDADDDRESVVEMTTDVDADKLHPFKKIAKKLVSTHVKLYVDDEKDTSLVHALMDSPIGKLKGECIVDHEGHELNKNFVAVLYDTKCAGESKSRPITRVPPLREGRLDRLLRGVLRVRCTDYTSDAPELPDGDLFVLQDGGKHGI